MTPRTLVHRGHIVASGLCFDAAWLDDAERRARVLALVDADATVLGLDDALLVVFATARRIDADHCEAAALHREGGSLFAAPLRAAEVAALALDGPSLVRTRAGEVRVDALARARAIDLSEWLDVDEWRELEVATLGIVPKPVRPREPAAAIPTDVRTVLGPAIPMPAAERQELIDAFANPKRDDAREPDDGPGWLDGVARWLSRTFSRGDRAAISGGASPAPSPVREPGALRRWLDRIVERSALAGIIGRKQAEYMQKMMALFETGDYHEALRHAIPLSSESTEGGSRSLWLPTPRGGLSLNANRKSVAPSIGVVTDAFEHMRKMYLAAARALEERGQIEEAAYVYFELLGDELGGIAMLERHGRFDLAARMAEGRNLAAGLVIRLWFLAGDAERAIIVARRTGAFADAIARLEANRPELAARLRLVWANRLADAGEYAAAVDVIWSQPADRSLVIAWLDRAIAWGGPTAARMLVRKLGLVGAHPELADAVRDAVHAMVADESPESIHVRHELAMAWQSVLCPPGSLALALGRPLCRQVMLDSTTTGNVGAAVGLRERLQDPAFAFDARATPPTTTRSIAAPRSHIFESHERGLSVIADAVPLTRGRWLVALGDAGIVLVDRSGRVLRRYEHPATQLVLADSGSRVITAMQRGDDSPATLGRIDLVTGSAEPWCDARIGLRAQEYDGATWFVADGDAVARIDAQADGLAVLWRVGQLPGPVVALTRTRTQLAFLVAHDRSGLRELWTYEVQTAGPVLRGRRQLDVGEDTTIAASVDANGVVVVTEGQLHALAPTDRTLVAPRNAIDGVLTGYSHALAWAARDDTRALVRLAWDSLTPSDPVLELRGATTSTIRRVRDHLVAYDDRGRIVELDPMGAILRWLLV
ncbi:MAG TPA: bpX6 domain-containing protein [Nannocystaceae bacterium]|nr:bpX6 domain-containing protein [Nannocystaceae bacterium]